MACVLNGGALTLSGYVGDDLWGDGFSYSNVMLALAQINDDEDLVVRINSAGGIATEGAAIHALLSTRTGKTDVVVEGIAASAASLIAMAGETVTMSLGSVMMIHDPSGMTWGTSEDHARTIEGLEALSTSYARVYASKSGKSASECREIMKAERWFTPEEAVEAGFADATADTSAKPVAAFDYRVFAHAPDRLVALARTKNWSFEANSAASAAQRPTEVSMTDKERADQLAAENAKLKADLEAVTASVGGAVQADRDRRSTIMALDDAKGREALAEHLFTTGMSVDDVKAALSTAPKATADVPDAAAYEAARVAGAGLRGVPPVATSEAAAGWSKAFARTNAA